MVQVERDPLTSELRSLHNAIVASTADAVIAFDVSGRITSWNGAAEKLFGYTASEAVGRSADLLVAPLGYVPKGETLRGAFDTALAGHTFQKDTKRVAKDGTIIDVSLTATQIREESGRILGVVAVMRDIRERKKSEDALRFSEEQLRLSTEAGDIGTFTIDTATSIFTCSSKTAALIGLPGGNSTALKAVLARVHRDDDDMVRQALFDAAQPGTAGRLNLEARFVHEDGDVRWLTLRGSSEQSAAGRGMRRIIGACVDVTERKAALQELARLNFELEERISERTSALKEEMERRAEAQLELAQAQRLESIGRLAGGLAHDFNNTLAAVATYLQLAEARISDANALESLRKALDAVELGASLNRRLLTLARRGPASQTLVATGPKLAAMIDLLERTVGSNISFELVCQPDLWMTQADPGGLESAILNLALNARDAMPDGGDVVITATNVTLDPLDFPQAMTSRDAADYIRIDVKDHGAGMPPDVLNSAGQPFFTTKSQGRGTGLGVSSVREFVRAAGGFMAITSAVGEGTCVTLYLPRAHNDAACETNGCDKDVPLGNGELILAVDDNQAVLQATHMLLEGLCYCVSSARSAENAIAQLRRGEPVSAIVSDIVMPGRSGYELAGLVAQEFPDVKVVLVSGYHEESDVAAGPKDITVLRKPYSRTQLAQTLRAALDGCLPSCSTSPAKT